MPGTPSFGGSPPASPPRFGSNSQLASFGQGTDADADERESAKPPRPPCSTPRRASLVYEEDGDELDGARSQELGQPLRRPPPSPSATGAGGLERFRMLATVGSGCFGEVRLAEAADGSKVAIKSVCEDAGREMREVELLREVKHPCVVPLLEAFRAPGLNGATALHIVMEYLPQNLHEHICGRPVSLLELKGLGFQLVRALAHLDGQRICHRDVKPENLLLGPAAAGLAGARCVRALKLADFGSAKKLGAGPSTSYICARWWRAPELIVGCTKYTTAVDWWSCGCVLAEMMLGRPLFPGASSMGQLDTIINLLGTPSKQELLAIGANMSGPDAAELTGLLEPHRRSRPLEQMLSAFAGQQDALELPARFLVYDPDTRLTPIQALCCRFFSDLADEPGSCLPPGMFDFTPEELKGCDTQSQQHLAALTRRQLTGRSPTFTESRSGSMLSCFGGGKVTGA